VIWTRVLPRAAPVNMPGFTYTVENRKLYFMFLDTPKNTENVDINNFEVRKLLDYNSVTGQNLICISVNRDGVLNRSLLSVNEKKTANFIPFDKIENSSDHSSVYRLINGKKEQYALFDFK
jgi:hypothetical protein